MEPSADESERPACDESDQEEPNTRRRHVTGDSGIEVCVCQLDVDEGSEEEEGRLCRGTAGGCCSEPQADGDKGVTPEPAVAAERLV